MAMRQSSLWLCVFLMTTGCLAMIERESARVHALYPRPLLDITPQQRTLALVISPSIRDAFEIPEQGSLTSVAVDDWHRSLSNGFVNGPGHFFPPTPRGALPDLQLVLLAAELDYIPVAMNGHGGARARVRYLARLVARDGTVLLRTGGETFSTHPWISTGGSRITATEALAQMYGELAMQMVGPASRETRTPEVLRRAGGSWREVTSSASDGNLVALAYPDERIPNGHPVDDAALRSTLAARLGALRQCFNREAEANPHLITMSGRIVAEFTVGPSGVANVRVVENAFTRPIGACLEQHLSSLPIPPDALRWTTLFRYGIESRPQSVRPGQQPVSAGNAI